MKKMYYGLFNSINDAKEALGRIKKESLNLVDLTVIYLEPDHEPKNNAEFQFEMASEHFLEGASVQNRSRVSIWPGLQEQEIDGIGKVLIGKNNSQNADGNIKLAKEDLATIEQEIINHKVTAIIEAEPQDTGKIRYILESVGAEIIEE